MSAAPCAALVPYLGHGDAGAAAWSRLAPSERRRTAMQAARDHDSPTLWSLTEAWLRTFSPTGATVSPGTVRSYRCGVHALLAAWIRQDLLHPDPESARLYIHLLERRGLAPSTIQAKGSTLRARHQRNVAGRDVHLARRDLVVRHGKGGKQRVVALSATLRQALQALQRRADGYVLPYRTAGSAWRHMQALCRAAEVTPKGVHALRHAAGTRLYAETRDLEATARHLGHSKLETTCIYAKWSDRQLRETIGRW